MITHTARAYDTDIRPVLWIDGPEPIVRMLDQRLLPTRTVWLDLDDPEAVARGITDMVVRGAPAIGISAAYGIALAMHQHARVSQDADAFDATLLRVCDRFAATRPTAVNLFWAIDRMRAAAASVAGRPIDERATRLIAEARTIHDEDIGYCRSMGDFGAALLPDEGGVITHCNAGALATGGYGTALGVLRSAFAGGKRLHVFVDETRPFLQGARLTAWECVTDGMAATLITDNMAGSLMQQGKIQAAVVGSDRIAANGDVANKIGTYAVAVLCRYHGIPFFVAAPTSTVDLACADGAAIPIEERTTREVSDIGGWAPDGAVVRVAPEGIAIHNPAFDVTPAALVTAIITERGVARPPFAQPLRQMVEAAERLRR